jgi:predicted transposase YbfD/YdcC
MEVSMSTVTGSPLLTALAQVPDFRQSQDKRHPLAAILALACVAMLCGYTTLTAMSQWGREHGENVLRQLGFTHFPGPCVATLHRIFKHLDAAALEQALTTWLAANWPGQGGLAIDGKTVRGSQGAGQDPLALLAAFAHTVGVALSQRAIANHDEIAAAVTLLREHDLHGWIVTGDAKFAQKTVAEAVLAQGGDYVLVVKGNQPTLQMDIATLFRESQVVADTITHYREANLHGQRIEQRTVQASTALTAEYCQWPGLRQVIQIERRVINKKTGAAAVEISYGISSLAAERADAQRLAALIRGHWRIENQLHWVRDAIFGEDRCRVRTGQAPHVLAAIRNLVIGVVRLAGFSSVTEALRHHAAHQRAATHLVSRPPRIAARVRMK